MARSRGDCGMPNICTPRLVFSGKPRWYWATVAELRAPGTLPAEGCDHGVPPEAKADPAA